MAQLHDLPRPGMLDATLHRVHIAEAKLWELSLSGQGDTLLPPALLQAVLAERPPRRPQSARAPASPRVPTRRMAQAQAAHRLLHPEEPAAAPSPLAGS